MNERPFAEKAQRVVVGFLTLVLGVMVALAADEWVEEREEDAHAEALVRRLVAELRADSVEIERFIAQGQTGLAAQSRIMHELETGILIPPDSLASIVTAGSGAPNWPPVRSATYVEMTSTGSLALLPVAARTEVLDYYQHYDWVMRTLGSLTWDLTPWTVDVPMGFHLDPTLEFSADDLRPMLRSSPQVLREFRALAVKTVTFLSVTERFLENAAVALRALEAVDVR